MNFRGNGLSYFSLHTQHITDVTIIGFSPELSLVRISLSCAVMRTRLPARLTLP